MPHLRIGRLTASDKKFFDSLDEDELLAARAVAMQQLGQALILDRPLARKLKKVLDFIDAVLAKREIKKGRKGKKR